MAGLDPRRPQGEVPSPQRRRWMDPSSIATPQGVSWAGGSSLAMVWKAPWMVLDTRVGSPPSAPSCSHSATGMNWDELGGKQGGGQSCRDTYWEVGMLERPGWKVLFKAFYIFLEQREWQWKWVKTYRQTVAEIAIQTHACTCTLHITVILIACNLAPSAPPFAFSFLLPHPPELICR